MNKLEKWDESTLRQFNILRARSYSTKKSLEKIIENVEDVHPYVYSSISGYVNSPEGEKGLAAALEVVREEAKNKTFAHRGSRVDALIEIASKLLFHFRASTKPSEMSRLATELRSTLAGIREEVDPYGIEDTSTRSHFEKLLSGFGKLEEKKQDMILEDQVWISTQPTESN